MEVPPPARDAVTRAEDDGAAPDDAPRGEEAGCDPAGLAAAEGREGVQPRPGRGDSRGGGGLPRQVEIGGQEERRGEEEEGQGLARAGVEGDGEHGQRGGGDGGCFLDLLVWGG